MASSNSSDKTAHSRKNSSNSRTPQPKSGSAPDSARLRSNSSSKTALKQTTPTTHHSPSSEDFAERKSIDTKIVTDSREEILIDDKINEYSEDVVNTVDGDHSAKQVDTQLIPSHIEELPKFFENSDMSTSMIIKNRITTEEEAKQKIAERRRIAREEAERQAEIERQIREAEEAAERERLLKEEENQRQIEQEALRLAEEQRKIEEQRLQQAIEENLKREEEERKKKEDEANMKAEREAAEKKAREDAEKSKAEAAERLKKEEKEREERRKRVEAIMSRTRKVGNNSSSQAKVCFH